MAKFLYAIIALCLVGWAIGFFVIGIGIIIHLLLLAAVIAAIIKVIRDN